ncbi:MAG TPA: polysaccharide deacetylase family protein [Thermoanaerobaculia bacterium]|jgi:peptidoglycan/xylan/chitin deacetylase (PgdA/CDA1 family)|nr:polysaccharide deacetylase family protein [Thermoanaerobaculia bacterium]
MSAEKTFASVRVALKIDVDTFRGTRDGVPALLADLAAAGVRASFFFTLGPDNSGRAVLRVFRKRGFLAKMLRTNAARMYGWRTALYGTLLPAPEIGRRCRATLAEVAAAGHEVGLHAWDHVTWQDRLDRLSRAAIDAQLDRGVAAFESIFGARPRGFAAPAWFCTDEGFAALDARGFDYLSVSRGAAPPFYPRVAGRVLATLEVPTTLPTLDEELGRDGVTPENYVRRLVARYRPGHDEVLTVHAETEGLAYRGLFQDLLRRHRELGVTTRTVGELAAAARDRAPAGDVAYGEVAGRAGRVVLASSIGGKVDLGGLPAAEQTCTLPRGNGGMSK